MPETSSPDIYLFNESGSDIPFQKNTVENIIGLISKHESAGFSFLEIACVDEEAIVFINSKYLEKDYVTDTISFRYDENTDNNSIEGTIFLCVPRIYEQSLEYNEPPETEFLRVLVHSLLHLVGYEDESPSLKKQMEKRENYYLEILGHG